MQIDTHLVNLSIYLPIFSALVIGIIHAIIKSIKNVLKSSSLLTFIFDIIFSILVIIINLFVFYLCNYGKLKLYSLLIELISYVVLRKIFGEILCRKLTKFNRVLKCKSWNRSFNNCCWCSKQRWNITSLGFYRWISFRFRR